MERRTLLRGLLVSAVGTEALVKLATPPSSPAPSSWPPSPREPLPPFPQPTDEQPGDPQSGCWTHDAFDPALPFTPPDHPDLDFHRGNGCGMAMPSDAPAVPGTPREVYFSWFQYLFDAAWQKKNLAMYAAAGYTHLDFHRAAWMGRLDGVPGCDRQTALDQVKRATDAGQHVIVNLAIDNGPPDRDELMPWIDDLAKASMKIGCLAWQADQRMGPLDLADYIAWAAPELHARGVKTAIHWMNHACARWDAKDVPAPSTGSRYGFSDRFGFQRWCSGFIDFHYEQFSTEAPILDIRPRQGGMMGEIQDVLESLTTQKLVITEYGYRSRFDHPRTRLEAYDCDLKGRSLLSTSYKGKTISGYLGGNRQPDGSVV